MTNNVLFYHGTGGEWLYITIKDIANQMNVSEETVRRWIRDGKLAAEDMGGRLGYRVLQEDFERFFQLRNGTSSAGVVAGAMLGSKVGARIGLFGGPIGLTVGAAVGGLLGGIVGQTFSTLTNSSKEEQQRTLEENRLKLEARKYEIEQAKIELEAQMKSLDTELLAIGRLLSQSVDSSDTKK